jgi:hypothetical protein
MLLQSDCHDIGHVDAVREWIIIKILQNLDDICIKMPTTNWLFEYASIIEHAYPVLAEHYAVCNGLKLLRHFERPRYVQTYS